MEIDDYLAFGGMGLTVAGGLAETKMLAMSAGARAKASLQNARAYRQNAIYEGINASKRQAGIRQSYKRVRERIKATSGASGFRASGELLREADLNERKTIEEMRFGSAMMARNFSQAAKRSIEQAQEAISGLRYQQRQSIYSTTGALLTQASDYNRAR